MRRIALAFILLLVASPIYAQLSVDDVYFSPHGGCTAAIEHELKAAKSTVRVQAYSFTSARIAKALNEASMREALDKTSTDKRKVSVKVLLDKGHKTETENNDKEGLLDNPEISVRLDGSNHARAHSKVIIIDPDLDSAVVITGSFNFTGHAENSNVENLLIIRDKKIAQKYLANWNDRAEHHSEPYTKVKRKEPAAAGSGR